MLYTSKLIYLIDIFSKLYLYFSKVWKNIRFRCFTLMFNIKLQNASGNHRTGTRQEAWSSWVSPGFGAIYVCPVCRGPRFGHLDILLTPSFAFSESEIFPVSIKQTRGRPWRRVQRGPLPRYILNDLSRCVCFFRILVSVMLGNTSCCQA